MSERLLALQQIAIGGRDKAAWAGLLGVEKVGTTELVQAPPDVLADRYAAGPQ